MEIACSAAAAAAAAAAPDEHFGPLLVLFAVRR